MSLSSSMSPGEDLFVLQQNLILSGMLLMVLTVLLKMARTSAMVGDDALDAHLEH